MFEAGALELEGAAAAGVDSSSLSSIPCPVAYAEVMVGPAKVQFSCARLYASVINFFPNRKVERSQSIVHLFLFSHFPPQTVPD